MSINVGIVDQRLTRLAVDLADRAQEELGVRNDEVRLRALAFVHLCVACLLDLDRETSFDCITDGGNDFGVDALHLTEPVDGEFVVTLFQAKYDGSLRGLGTFEANAVEKVIQAIRYLFDPGAVLTHLNPRLATKVEAARSLVRDGHIPRVRAALCNNGLRWSPAAEELIRVADLGDQVSFEHVNHDTLVRLLQAPKSVDDVLRLVGRATVEDMNHSRVCVGRIAVTEIAQLMRVHGDRLLERNIRRYLGLHGNRVNEGIRTTLTSEAASSFYFLNNGVTVACSKFSYNALQQGDYAVRCERLHIVNGGQTCMTIFKTEEALRAQGKSLPADASVLVRIYELPDDDETVDRITHATNSQNPVDLRDLQANDARQLRLEASVQDLGYVYRRKRVDDSMTTKEFSSATAAEAVLAVWRHAPHQAKFLTREHFGKLYDTIFADELNGAQTVCAVLLYRIAENHRRRPAADDPDFVRYASCFLAMQMGRRLLRDLDGIALSKLDHRSFARAAELISSEGETYFGESVQDLRRALRDLYGNRDLSLQQLSATFRRGDLVSALDAMEV